MASCDPAASLLAAEVGRLSGVIGVRMDQEDAVPAHGDAVGKQPTRDKLIAGLESMQQFDLGGVDVSYGPGLRTGTSYIDITIIGKTGKFVR